MTRRGDIIDAATGREQLVDAGFAHTEIDETTAFRVFMARACRPDLEPWRADEDYRRGAISGRDYLRQVAPEELAEGDARA